MKASFLLLGLAMGCVSETSDESMYLTGTEENAVMLNGQMTCTNPKKVLVCHIPPGNPDNAHDICVSTHAVAPHQQHHGDTVGACAPTPPDDPPPPPPDDDPPPPPPGDEPPAPL
jgi:hypothetical protein